MNNLSRFYNKYIRIVCKVSRCLYMTTIRRYVNARTFRKEYLIDPSLSHSKKSSFFKPEIRKEQNYKLLWM